MRKENAIYCNMCGKKIEQKQGIPMEDFVSVKKTWGYFSKKDGVVQECDLCEDCFDEIVRQFRIPAAQSELKEML